MWSSNHKMLPDPRYLHASTPDSATHKHFAKRLLDEPNQAPAPPTRYKTAIVSAQQYRNQRNADRRRQQQRERLMYQQLPYEIKNGESASVGASTTVLVASAQTLSSGSKLGGAGKRSNPADSDHVSWRVLAAYWLLGLCNNYGYVVMISAAYDILEKPENQPRLMPNGTNPTEPVIKLRECNEISTGAILLADILPSLIAKLLSPFLPLWIHFRLGTVIILNVIGFLVVSQAPYPWVLLGVGAVSLGSGLGEVTLLAYMAFFRDRNVITMWSSGTGGAGVLGSFSYAIITKFLSKEDTLLAIIVVPLSMAAIFWMLMVHPKREKDDESISKTTLGIDDVPTNYTRASFKDRLLAIPPLLKYIVPLILVYLFEYFINQGLLEMIQYDNINLSHNEQYRWLQVDYQVGVFLSRSSGSIIHIERTWILALLQGLNVIYFVLEVLYRFSHYFYVVLVVVFFEGLLGGGAYVNTFFCISKKVPADKREFSLGISSMGDAIGISLAGFLAIPVHNYLCKLPYL